jgi:hypothetical protein
VQQSGDLTPEVKAQLEAQQAELKAQMEMEKQQAAASAAVRGGRGGAGGVSGCTRPRRHLLRVVSTCPP